MNWRRLLNEPSRIGGLVRAFFVLIGAFGFELTVPQLAALYGFVDLVTTEIQRMLVTPNALAEYRHSIGQPPTVPLDNERSEMRDKKD